MNDDPVFYYVRLNKEGKAIGWKATYTPMPYTAMKMVTREEYEALGLNPDSVTIDEAYIQRLKERQNAETEKLLEAKTKALSDRNDFLEECIVEMAGLVYGE